MKYALLDTYWWFDTNDYIDHKESKWVQGITPRKFMSRPATMFQRTVRTKLLSEAKLYDTADEAAAVASLLHDPDAPTEIVVISDRRLFEARLKGE